MPNIIEQQDLLKGLPDARLSLLLQKPDASIPPFLVAAEAQRRQAVRQQFAGSAGKESVVDTLTKQLSNVPQNIKAPMQTPPNIPPPQMQPQMAGIGALPQGQQAMAGGGEVRRFATGSIVTPKVSDLSGAITGETREQYLARVKKERIDAMQPGRAKYLLQHPTIPKTEAQLAEEEVYATTEGPLSGFYSDESKYDAAAAADAAATRKASEEDGSNGATNIDMGGISDLLPNKKLPNPSKPPSSTKGTSDTSPENKYKAMEADMRKRLEDLYAADEPSNWEDAQKWFAMSQQIMNPDATLMQGLVNAGAVYAGAEGEQSAQAREAARARDEAMLNWDMQIMQGDRAAEADAAAKAQEHAWKLEERSVLGPEALLKHYDDQIAAILKLAEVEMDPAKKDTLLRQVEGLRATAAEVASMGGGGGNVVTRDQLPQSSFSFK